MKTYLVSLVICIFSITNVATQNTTFSRLLNLVKGNEYGRELKLINNEYFVLSEGVCDPTLPGIVGCLSITILDQETNITLNQTRVNEDWFSWGIYRPLQCFNDTIVIFGVDPFSSTPYDRNFYYTNINGDSLGLYIYQHDIDEDLRFQTMQVKGDYIYIAGTKVHNDSGGNIIIIKLDKQANHIKENRFLDLSVAGSVNQTWDFVRTTDGHFMAAVLTYIPHKVSGEDSYRIAKLLKFDENLDTIWSTAFTKNAGSHFNHPDLTPTDDGGVVVSWSLNIGDDYYNLEDKIPLYGLYPPLLYKFDKDANMIWSDTMWTDRPADYPNPPQAYPYKLITARNGDIIGTGRYRQYEQDKIWGWIFRYSPDGEMLWQKAYEDTNFESKSDFFLDLEEADNGDIVCTGQLWDLNGEWNNATHVWLLRVDSLGCFEPGCGASTDLQLVYTSSEFITGSKELESPKPTKQALILSPNPCSENVFVKMPNPISGIVWQLMDELGKKVLSGTESGQLDSFEIKLNNINSGLYFLQVKDGNGEVYQVAKLTVEQS